MLRIINSLKPFLEDNYRRIHVREYAKIQKISPPTASKVLEEMHKVGLLKKEIDKGYFDYYANKSSDLLIDFQRMYWKIKLKKIGLINYIKSMDSIIILFGSLAKAEAKKDSDVDIAVFASSLKKINLGKFEKKLGREIQLFNFKKLSEVPKELRNNILNGEIVEGSW